MRSIASCLALLFLSGCGVTAVAVKPALPTLPAAASEACVKPVAKLKDDLGVLALRWKAYGICERGKRSAITTFYVDLQKGLSGNDKP